ncbi:zinc-binding metallopeptidase family protein [Archangium primigenium]|uniref:zinc-binding metallopeptidase family protein n=1 Tax=[Archangium] primigenium TaxID=2792470 RepID=UPI00195DF9C8|nr:putative zinc-binding metallopeptidase [Archangium primigenium]
MSCSHPLAPLVEMKIFNCQQCGLMVYFSNTRCERCAHALGYLPELTTLSALTPLEDGRFSPLAAPERTSRFCANAAHAACNWLVPADSPDDYCRACQLNRTIPPLNEGDNLLRWQRLEVAKHQLVYGLLRLGLPVVGKGEEPERGLAFDFLARLKGKGGKPAPVVTGHASGLITIDVTEADDAERERHRRDLAEPYRTLLGHFRHEVGHYYWDRLVNGGPWLDAFRTLFGDERQDYGECLKAHYADGPPADWRQRFVSSYASTHPWEDFAETWAHYLHIVDTLETAHAFGLRVQPRGAQDAALTMEIDFEPYHQSDFDVLLKTWLPLTYAVNSLNQSMGQPDLYPFVLAPAVMGKLRFVHALVFPAKVAAMNALSAMQ